MQTEEINIKDNTEILKNEIFRLTKQYHKEKFAEEEFIPGLSTVPVSGKVFGHEEIENIVESALDGWFTTGRFNKIFEKDLAKFTGARKAVTLNSGSSANLIAFASLTSEKLGSRALKSGDEIITTPVSFPTTVNPALLYGMVPVFVDASLPTYNIDVDKIEEAISPRTKAIMVAHTLGNPFNAERVLQLAKKYNLWMIEDCCDALGAKFKGKHVGNFGDAATLSFYPAHHITMGEGGAIFTNNLPLKKIIESFRDWGRDCWCDPGNDNTCGKRFEWQLGDLPLGYDHKYIYSHLGFNLKITDMQAALGLAQLKKLPEFIKIRNHNFDRIKEGLLDLSDRLILPEATPDSEPSWFGFLITVRDDAGITRNELTAKLNEAKIATRLLFAGDIRRQPYFKNHKYRVSGGMKNADVILNQTFWVGVTPMISDKMIDYMIEIFHKILR